MMKGGSLCLSWNRWRISEARSEELQSGMCKFYTYHFCCLRESLAKAFKIEWDLGSLLFH